MEALTGLEYLPVVIIGLVTVDRINCQCKNNIAKEALLQMKLLLGFKPIYTERC